MGRVLFAALALVGAVGTAAVYWYGSRAVVNGSLKLGAVVALAALVSKLYSPLTDLAGARVDLLTAMVSFERCFEVLDAPRAIQEAPEARALANPRLDLDEAPDAAAIAAAELVASPLRRHQVSRPVDGAVAILLATEDVARRVTPSPVWITGMGAAIDSQMLTERTPGEFEAAATAASAAYRRAGITAPGSIALAEVSATSIAEELMVLEALGLAGMGLGASLYNDDSPILVNHSGGALPADPIMATGLARLGEATRSLLSGRSSSGTAVVHASGGIGMQNHCVFTLEV